MRIRLQVVREKRRKEFLIASPADVLKLLRSELRSSDREWFWRIDLDVRSRVLSYEVVSIGTLTAALVHPREFFKGALLANAAALLAVHNHPSGDAQPSAEDRATTRRLKRAGQLLGVPLIDHVIVAGSKYFSFKEAGLL